MKTLTYIIIFGFILTPELTTAAGFVTCSGVDCSACDLVSMANTVLVWLIGILFIIFAVIAAIAGFGMVTSGGNPQALTDAKAKMTNAVVGIVIVLAAWLLVDTVMKGLLSGGTGTIDGYGLWSEVKCQSQATMAPPKNLTTNTTPGYRACPESLNINNTAQQPVTVYHSTAPLPSCDVILANPGNYTTANQTAKWSSSNPKLVSVSPAGTITTHSENSSGFESVVITGTYEDGSVAEVLVYSGGGGSGGGGDQSGPGVSVGDTCYVSTEIESCHELPLNVNLDDSLASNKKDVYHFKVNSGDAVQGYEVSVVGIVYDGGGSVTVFTLAYRKPRAIPGLPRASKPHVLRARRSGLWSPSIPEGLV